MADTATQCRSCKPMVNKQESNVMTVIIGFTVSQHDPLTNNARSLHALAPKIANARGFLRGVITLFPLD